MKKTALLLGRRIRYTLKRSGRSRGPSISVYPDGSIVVTVPRKSPAREARRFLKEKARWVLGRRAECRAARGIVVPGGGRSAFDRYRAHALRTITERVLFFNRQYRLPFKEIAVKDVRAQWGSCSSDKNLNFNYRVLFLPPRLRDYVIVHELCHLRTLDHSGRFWRTVARAIPDYARREERLGRYMLARF